MVVEKTIRAYGLKERKRKKGVEEEGGRGNKGKAQGGAS